MRLHRGVEVASRIDGLRFRATDRGDRLSGYFITLEGLDGSGKSSVARRLEYWLRSLGTRVLLTREPGGTKIGESIRGLLFGEHSRNMLVETEALLFAAARSQLVSEVLEPALQNGDIVICDRFADSSLAYQWGGRGLPLSEVKAAQHLAVRGCEPDLKILLDLSPQVAMERKTRGFDPTNRFDDEDLAFHQRVRDAYLFLAASEPSRWQIIDSARDEDEVWRDVRETIERREVLSIAGHIDNARSAQEGLL
jgi:dTMP kinase